MLLKKQGILHKTISIKDESIKIYIFLAIVIIAGKINGQYPVYQTIKGTVRDIDTHVLLSGATIIVESVNPAIGVSSDSEGNFKLTQVPIGRHTLRIAYLGYEPYIVRELMVSSGKEVVLIIDLKESTIALNEVTVKANSNKEQPINSMASISARQLSVEEANRYAGGFDDPARLASAYAGVSSNLSNNGIVIRGNSPKGMLWKIEGVEISTPSHFANITTFGGGGITALSSQMLTNSDFYTGAFPAEFGNALSGVFDLKLRNGNNEKTEFTIQAGIIGLDLAIEGPFIKGKKSSFLFNYRYSTFSIIAPLLPADAGGIRYQDLCFKLNFPTSKAGTFTVWGIGALDNSPQCAEKDSSNWIYNQDMEEGKNDLGMGGLGINNNIILGNTSYLHTSIAVSGNGLNHNQERYNTNIVLEPLNKVEYYTWNYTFSSSLNHKFSAKHTNRTGFIMTKMNYDIDIREASVAGDPLIQLISGKASSNLYQYFTQSKLEVTPKITLLAGLHGQYFELNKEQVLEPRASITFSFLPKQIITLGFGMHSQMEMIQVYLIQKGDTYPNKDLKFTKAQHIILSYDWKINSNLHFKAEPYYQLLTQVPVIDNNSFSILNLDKNWYLTDSLTNKGKGNNMGIDLTLEHFLHEGYYYMITTSLLQSKYKGGDGIKRNTRYNRKYVINVLGGKEWTLKSNNILSINGRLNFSGGERISPLNMQASLAAKDEIYDNMRAFADSKPDVWYGDFTINYKINREKHSSTWSFKIINAFGTKEFSGYRYNHKTSLMEKEEEATIIPNLSYKIEF